MKRVRTIMSAVSPSFLARTELLAKLIDEKRDRLCTVQTTQHNRINQQRMVKGSNTIDRDAAAP